MFVVGTWPLNYLMEIKKAFVVILVDAGFIIHDYWHSQHALGRSLHYPLRHCGWVNQGSPVHQCPVPWIIQPPPASVLNQAETGTIPSLVTHIYLSLCLPRGNIESSRFTRDLISVALIAMFNNCFAQIYIVSTDLDHEPFVIFTATFPIEH